MQMDDEVPRLRPVNRSLSLGFPSIVRRLVVGEYADDIKIRQIAEPQRVDRLQLATEYKMQKLGRALRVFEIR